KHGVARGVAVYGSPGLQKDPGRLADLLADCRTLRAWAEEHGCHLDDSPESLSALDEAMDHFADQETTNGLANEAGLYLGSLLARRDDPACRRSGDRSPCTPNAIRARPRCRCHRQRRISLREARTRETLCGRDRRQANLTVPADRPDTHARPGAHRPSTTSR